MFLSTAASVYKLGTAPAVGIAVKRRKKGDSCPSFPDPDKLAVIPWAQLRNRLHSVATEISVTESAEVTMVY